MRSPPDQQEQEALLSVIGFAALAIAASIAAIVALSTQSFRQEDRPKILTAKLLADEIIAAASATPVADSAIKAYVLSGADNRTMLFVEQVPRRLCPASGWILAQKGVLRVNGALPSPLTKPAITALCYRQAGDANFIWSPSANALSLASASANKSSSP